MKEISQRLGQEDWLLIDTTLRAFSLEIRGNPGGNPGKSGDRRDVPQSYLLVTNILARFRPVP